jgi:hypothetical protein
LGYFVSHSKYIAVPFTKGESKKIGSKNSVFSVRQHRNFRIAERTLACEFKNTWKIAEKYHAEAQRAEAKSFNFAQSAIWRCFLDEVRTFFQTNPNFE